VPIGVSREEYDFSYEAYARLYPQDYAGMSNDYYYTPYYVLNNPEDLDSFTAAAQELLPQYYTVVSAQSQYESVAAPLLSIQRIMEIALIVVVLAALAIITLVIILFLRDRRHEFGIYISLGERKPRVLGQVLVEVLLVAVVALSLSLVSGNLIARGVGQTLLDSQIEEEQNSYSSTASFYVGSGQEGMLMSNLSLEDVTANYQVGFSASYILLFYAVGLGTVLVACVAPMLYVLRLKPKKILM